MDKIITDFSDFIAGWMNMSIYDYRTDEVRKIRISYVQDFFDDLVMMGRFLVSDLTGIYELSIDQEGWETQVRCFKYQTGKNAQMSVEIITPVFEDEHFNVMEDELIDNHLIYFNVSIEKFISNIIYLVKKYEKEYNEGFVLSPSNELDRYQLQKLEKSFKRKFRKGIRNEKISNS